MVATGTGIRLDELAQDLLGLLTRLGMARPRLRRADADLRDLEYLALSLLQENGTQIVGRLQRQLGVLPAQMSRIIRSLEARTRPLVACQINNDDKRKINVHLTSAGLRALEDYRAHRVQPIQQLLQELPESECVDLARVLDRLSTLLLDQRQPACSTNGSQIEGPAVAG